MLKMIVKFELIKIIIPSNVFPHFLTQVYKYFSLANFHKLSQIFQLPGGGVLVDGRVGRVVGAENDQKV